MPLNEEEKEEEEEIIMAIISKTMTIVIIIIIIPNTLPLKIQENTYLTFFLKSLSSNSEICVLLM